MTTRFSPGALLAPAIDWLNAHFHPVFAAIGWFVETVLTGIEAALLFVPWYGLIAVVVVLAAVAAIAGHLAFYPNRVDAIQVG